MGYQHIDLSIKKHGLYSEENLYGWKIKFMNLKKAELDDAEQHFIKLYASHGYQLRNKTSGSQGKVRSRLMNTVRQKDTEMAWNRAERIWLESYPISLIST